MGREGGCSQQFVFAAGESERDNERHHQAENNEEQESDKVFSGHSVFHTVRVTGPFWNQGGVLPVLFQLDSSRPEALGNFWNYS